MHKTCTHCSAAFDITPEDLDFYELVSPTYAGKKFSIPPPTHCPDCRQQRRLAFRNERNMYKRRCDFTQAEIISMYPPDSPFKVYEQEIWWGDRWNALEYGRDFDFSRPFFEQFRELQLQVPRVALVNKQSENSHFTNHSGKDKNCYMSAVTFESEDIYYCDWVIDHCKDLVDCSYMLEGCELCYETYYAWGSYRALHCDFIKRCENVSFCYDCMNCRDCILCANLRGKQYCIRNEQFTKEEYDAKLQEFLPFTRTGLDRLRQEYIQMKEHRAIHPASYQVQSENCSGDLLFYSKNCTACFDSIKMQDCRHCIDAIDMKDSLDVYHVGWAELMYECHAISNGYQCLACHFTYDNKNAAYCDCTQNCRDVFGCSGLYQKQYCILNKQYSKEEYEALATRICEHMEKTGEWGEFFPLRFSPFAYNQSRAQEYYPLTREQALEQGIPWSDYEPPLPEAREVIEASEMPETIDATEDRILSIAIRCEQMKKLFKIIKQELDLYRKMGIPVPRRHPDQRYNDRMAQRNPRRLWKRACAKCGKEIETSYSPKRPEIVYCEFCYLQEVY